MPNRPRHRRALSSPRHRRDRNLLAYLLRQAEGEGSNAMSESIDQPAPIVGPCDDDEHDEERDADDVQRDDDDA